ncbi:hypothetical protein HDV06_002946 [Boothiomyces sp. JEL0866]|nr:hypothetical protein HDV06_002946 [Boothiomyces sp. JEL0866]
MSNCGFLLDWPPKAEFNFDSAFQPYIQAADYATDNIATCTPSAVDEFNLSKINQFRHCVKNILEQVNVAEVENWLVNGKDTLRKPKLLGLLACIDFLRHAYRWGTVPIVRVAQDQSVQFPIQLELPARILHNHFGIIPESGSLFSMTYCNIVKNDSGNLDIRYSSTGGMSEVIRRTERNNATVFYLMEEKAVLLYQTIILANDLFDAGLLSESLSCIQMMKGILKAVLSVFYHYLTEENIKKDLWLQYAQGFHGWAMNGLDGVSGNQALVIRVMDLFLELKHHTVIGKEQLANKHQPQFVLDFIDKVTLFNADIANAAPIKNCRNTRI